MSQWIGSPNFTAGRAGNTISGVVIHWMAGNLASTDNVFQNRERNTSAGYGIEDDVIHQYVKDGDTAYHAGNWNVNLVTIGIEHSAQPGRAPSDATYESTSRLIAEKAGAFGFPIDSAHIRHHYEIVATQCPGPVPGDGVDEARILRRANELLGVVVTPAIPAQVPAPASHAGIATVTVDTVMVRTAPNRTAPLGGSQRLTRGMTFEFVAAVQGENVGGVSTWLKSTRGNYVWAGGLDYATTPVVHTAQGGIATVIRTVNVRTAPSTTAALGGSKQLKQGVTFGYSALVHGQTISQNGITTDLWYHSNVGNYVWSGNCK